jgi:hypothetical protein
MQIPRTLAISLGVIMAAGAAAFAQTHEHRPESLTVAQP